MALEMKSNLSSEIIALLLQSDLCARETFAYLFSDESKWCGNCGGNYIEDDLLQDSPRNGEEYFVCNHWMCTDCWSEREGRCPYGDYESYDWFRSFRDISSLVSDVPSLIIPLNQSIIPLDPPNHRLCEE